MTRLTATTKTKDIVCGMIIQPDEELYVGIHQYHSFYFCSEKCKKAFEKKPKKYLNPKNKGIWARWLERLNKTTSGQKPKCH